MLRIRLLLFVSVLLIFQKIVHSQHLTLYDAIKHTLENNDREMYQAEQNFLSEQLQYKISESTYKPTINFSIATQRSESRLLNEDDEHYSNTQTVSPHLSIGYKIPTPFGSHTTLNLGYQSEIRNNSIYSSPSLNVSYRQPLSLSGIQSGHLDYIRTKKSSITSEMSYQLQKENLILSVINNYFQLWRSIRSIEQKEKNLESTKRITDIAEMKLKAGQISEFEAMNARVQYQLAVDEFDVAQYNLKNQKRDFLRLLGDKTSTDVFLVNEITIDTINFDLDRAIEIAFQNRLDVKQNKINRELAELTLKQSFSTAYPTLNINGNYSLSSQYDVPFGDALSHFPYRQWTISASLEYSIFDGGNRSKRRQIAQISYDLQQRDFKHFNENIILQLEEHDRALQLNEKRIQSLKLNLQIAEESLKIAELKFSQGNVSSTEIENVRERLNSAQEAIINAQITYIIQSAQFAQAMGILEQWVENLKNPSEYLE